MFILGQVRPSLNICAPKPRVRVPRLDPVPVGFNTFMVREGGVTILPCQMVALYPEGKEGEGNIPRETCTLFSPPSTTNPTGKG